MRALGWIVAVGVGAGCGSDPFQCASDVQCVQGDVQGQCLGLGSCAFPDADCASGLRFGEHALDSAGQCVPVMGTSTGSSGTSGSTTTSGSPGSTSSATLAVDGTSSSSGGTPTDDGASTGEPVDPDLLVWYRFQSPDLFADAGALGLDAVCVDGQCPVAAADRGIELDGEGTALRVEAGAMLNVSAPWTVMVWARPQLDPIDDFRSVIGKPLGRLTSNSWEIGSFDSVWWGSGAGAGRSAPLTPLGQWVHLAIRHDGRTFTLLVDGAATGEAPTMVLDYDMQPMMIGADIDNQIVDNFFLGAIDDVRVYARALDETELAAVIERTREGG